MSARPAPLTREQGSQLGVVVLAMRSDGLPWKVIEALLGMSPKQLRRLMRMSQKSAAMSHHHASALPPAA